VIRVVIADDHQILREGLKQLLQAAGDVVIAGEAGDGFEVLERVRTLDFDVLLLDMSMPGKSGVELIRQVKSENESFKERIRKNLQRKFVQQHETLLHAVAKGDGKQAENLARAHIEQAADFMINRLAREAEASR